MSFIAPPAYLACRCLWRIIALVADHPRPHRWEHLVAIGGVEQVGFADRLVAAATALAMLVLAPCLLLGPVVRGRQQRLVNRFFIMFVGGALAGRQLAQLWWQQDHPCCQHPALGAGCWLGRIGQCRQLVKQTMLGSYHLINNAEKSLDELIQAVASKGGTTEAALSTFEKTGVAEGIIAGMHAAENRAKELSK